MVRRQQRSTLRYWPTRDRLPHERYLALGGCPYRKLKFGNIDGAVRQEQGWQQCGRRAELHARGAHLCPTRGAFEIHCSSERNISEPDADVPRTGQ